MDSSGQKFSETENNMTMEMSIKLWLDLHLVSFLCHFKDRNLALLRIPARDEICPLLLT
jgi:hypothetical protein